MDVELEELRFELDGDIDLRGFLGISEDVRPGYSTMTCTTYITTDASDDEVIELRERVEETSPLLDVITNEAPLETDVIVT